MSESFEIETDFTRNIRFEPLGRKNWDKFVELFGRNGACANCWCMYYRLSKSEFRDGQTKRLNRRRMKKIVWSGKPTGLLAVSKGKALAWLAMAPRDDLAKLARSRLHKPVDDEEVWSIPCFFVRKDFRHKGLSVALLKGAIAYAERRKIKILEAYPVVSSGKKWPDSSLWVGLYKSFEKVGFKIVDRTSQSRPTVRYALKKKLNAKRRTRATGVT